MVLSVFFFLDGGVHILPKTSVLPGNCGRELSSPACKWNAHSKGKKEVEILSGMFINLNRSVVSVFTTKVIPQVSKNLCHSLVKIF